MMLARLRGHRSVSMSPLLAAAATAMPATMAPVAQAASTPFPSLTVARDTIKANGTFAEAQVSFLMPDADDVAELDEALARARLGVVAHYYMDPEIQGIITAAKWPHVTISDSLVMGDAAVRMVRDGGVDAIACLGVDFMAESVKATLDKEGLTHVPVYRLAQEAIGCSLAESAESPAYHAWLNKAAAKARASRTPALHVVYINTSIVTKAEAQSVVPTITCTSSNVVQTVLQAFAEVPNLTVWYGPDTYMGENLRTLFASVAETMNDDTIRRTLHPAHSRSSLRALLDRFEVFPQGNCVVHHMFGGAVAEKVRTDHADAYVTAHLEVPGEMFAVANEKVAEGRGAVGSTSNILDFIVKKTTLAAAVDAKQDKTLSFVLGTEAGMITPIVRRVQDVLRTYESDVAVEIIFPVAADAVTATGESAAGGLALVPGTSGGEGCSAAGGCATCPFMKMNDLDALLDVATQITNSSAEAMSRYLPIRRAAQVGGEPAGVLGTVPITHMRHLSSSGKLSDELVQDMLTRY
jgi:quinolinate synthase